jgi:hypothetical protein
LFFFRRYSVFVQVANGLGCHLEGVRLHT